MDFNCFDNSFKHEILTSFKLNYSRNNKRSDYKVMRCFPDCCIPGKHNKYGYCGQQIKAVLSTKDKSFRSRNFRIYCRCRPLDSQVEFFHYELKQKYGTNDLLNDTGLIEADFEMIGEIENTVLNITALAGKKGIPYQW